MDNNKKEAPRRILIIDDNHLIHGDFHKIFASQDHTRAALEDDAKLLFGDTYPEPEPLHFIVDSAYQGQEGAKKVKQAIDQNKPYAMAIVDMRMPLGWDGVKTAQELWKIDPNIQVVISTAYSDFSWKEMTQAVGRRDRIVILKKPFEPIEVIQLANMLTEKWVLERKARQRMEHLEAEISKRTRDLQSANLHLKQRNKDIQYFYHTLSHELKTPLTAAKEFIAIVNDGLAGELNPEQKEYLGIAKESCSRLAIYIDDLFDAARLDTGKLTLNLKPVSLAKLINHVSTIMRSSAEERGISLSQELDLEIGDIVADGHRIVQVLTNLYNNALKFTPQGGSITTRLYRDERNPERIEIAVEDTGCGIPDEQICHLFKRFYQVEQTGHKHEKGVGLGLYLCRELLLLHEGDIRASSELGKGSTFVVSLPAIHAVEESEPSPVAQGKANDQTRDVSTTAV